MLRPPAITARRFSTRPRGLAGALRPLAAAAAVASLSCAHAPPKVNEFLAGLAHEGYTPNAGLSGLFQPGNIIQTMEMGDDGKPRKLSPPIILAWGSDCYPGVEPREGPFVVEQRSGKSNRDFSLEGPQMFALLPSLNLDVGSVSEHRLTLQNPRVRAFAKGDISGKMSQKCIDAIAHAVQSGDRPEWFTIVLESVVVDSLKLEISWAAGASFEAKQKVLDQAGQLFSAIAGQIASSSSNSNATPTNGPTPVLNADGTPVLNPDGTPVMKPDASAANAGGTPVMNPDGTPALNPDGTPVVNPAGSTRGIHSGPKHDLLGGGKVKIGGAEQKGTAVELGAGAVVAYRTRRLQAYSTAPGAAPGADAAAGAPQPNSAGMPPDALRDTFQSGAASIDKPAVGRIAILKVTRGGSSHRVRLDHPFRSGQAFQLEVTSSRDGWLFILHATPGQAPQLLWPRIGADGQAIDQNAVRASVPMIVPASPASLRFDDEAGQELMYAVIRSTPVPPQLGPTPAGALQQAPSAPAESQKPVYLAAADISGPNVQYAVRGLKGAPVRGVVFDPGTQDADPSVYFSPASGGPGEDAIIEFRLNHAP